jgi:hypothetical protein
MNLITGIIKRASKNTLLRYFAWLSLILVVLPGCSNHGGNKSDDDDENGSSNVKSKVEVTITSPRIGTISQYETLNATTSYLLNASVRAPIAGYIRKLNVTPGQVVKEGDVLFTMQSKEAAAMKAIKDTSLHFTGTIIVKATEAGTVKTISRQLDDYVQDGDELCTIANSSSLVFMLDVPFEMRKNIKEGSNYTVTLPDGESLEAHITSRIPEMDKTVQMERYVLRGATPLSLPSGLIASVKIPTKSENNAVIVVKSAVLCDETQTQFWVMKLVKDSLAIKIPIEKGAETKDSVQIVKPVFSVNDKIVISGNYGLADTALVKVIK